MEKMKPRKFDKESYDFYVKEYIRKSEEIDKPISCGKLRFFDLPDARWFVNNCPNDFVKTYSDFVYWCGFITHNAPLKKERAIELIYKMQEKLNRPLKYDDFRGSGCYRVPIKYINETWGSVNNMKKELGLEIIQDSMIDKHLTKDDFDKMIEDICIFVKNDNRNFITTAEIDKNCCWRNTYTLGKLSKKYYNSSLRELLEKRNVYLGNRGQGITFDFEDGEHISSQFEYIFSKYLRNCGLIYNKNYFRDVKYKTFIPECNKNIDCDYVVINNGKTIYIEIAGILDGYKKWFYENKIIEKRESREKYRKKLKYKEELLKANNLKYFILFPCDLTISNFDRILKNPSLELKKEIESFNQNNIDWNKVRELGELDYSKCIIRNTYKKKVTA